MRSLTDPKRKGREVRLLLCLNVRGYDSETTKVGEFSVIEMIYTARIQETWVVPDPSAFALGVEMIATLALPVWGAIL